MNEEKKGRSKDAHKGCAQTVIAPPFVGWLEFEGLKGYRVGKVSGVSFLRKLHRLGCSSNVTAMGRGPVGRILARRTVGFEKKHSGKGWIIFYRIAKVIHFCYGHRLLNYHGKCQHLHGHNGKVEIELLSPTLDNRGMVADFGDVNRIVKEWIDRELDHKMILCREDPLLPVMEKFEQPVYVMGENPTAENIAKLIFEYAKNQGLPVSEVRLWEPPTSFASYRESGNGEQ